MQPFHQYLTHEILGRHAGQHGIEFQTEQIIDTQAGNQLCLLLLHGDEWRGLFSGKKAQRMRLKSNDHRWPPLPGSPVTHPRNETLVSDMDTVEISDGHAGA